MANASMKYFFCFLSFVGPGNGGSLLPLPGCLPSFPGRLPPFKFNVHLPSLPDNLSSLTGSLPSFLSHR